MPIEKQLKNQINNLLPKYMANKVLANLNILFPDAINPDEAATAVEAADNEEKATTQDIGKARNEVLKVAKQLEAIADNLGLKQEDEGVAEEKNRPRTSSNASIDSTAGDDLANAAAYSKLERVLERLNNINNADKPFLPKLLLMLNKNEISFEELATCKSSKILLLPWLKEQMGEADFKRLLPLYGIDEFLTIGKSFLTNTNDYKSLRLDKVIIDLLNSTENGAKEKIAQLRDDKGHSFFPLHEVIKLTDYQNEDQKLLDLYYADKEAVGIALKENTNLVKLSTTTLKHLQEIVFDSLDPNEHILMLPIGYKRKFDDSYYKSGAPALMKQALEGAESNINFSLKLSELGKKHPDYLNEKPIEKVNPWSLPDHGQCLAVQLKPNKKFQQSKDIITNFWGNRIKYFDITLSNVADFPISDSKKRKLIKSFMLDLIKNATTQTQLLDLYKRFNALTFSNPKLKKIMHDDHGRTTRFKAQDPAKRWGDLTATTKAFSAIELAFKNKNIDLERQKDQVASNEEKKEDPKIAKQTQLWSRELNARRRKTGFWVSIVHWLIRWGKGPKRLTPRIEDLTTNLNVLNEEAKPSSPESTLVIDFPATDLSLLSTDAKQKIGASVKVTEKSLTRSKSAPNLLNVSQNLPKEKPAISLKISDHNPSDLKSIFLHPNRDLTNPVSNAPAA